MTDCISREDAMDIFACGKEIWRDYEAAACIAALPAADVAPIKRGKWVKTKEYYQAGCVFLRVAWKCSCCGIEVVNTEPIYRIDDWYYCPNCGAKMEADNG